VRVLICGGREFQGRLYLKRVLDGLDGEIGIGTVIHGAARGADSLAGEWAKWSGKKVEEYPADWRAHGKAAGMIRNRQMLTEGKPDLVVAFPGGRGTDGMIRLAEQAGVEVRRFGGHYARCER